MGSYARSLRRALSLRRPVPAPAVELPAAGAPDPKLRALEATAPQLLDPKLGLEREDDEAHRSTEACEVPLEERWTFDNPPPWHRQFTVRGMVVGAIVSVALSFIVIKLELTTGIMPSLSMATSLIAFGVLKAYTAVLTRLGWHHAQFTPQENVLVQAWAGCLSGSIGINLLALDLQSYVNIGDVPGNRREDVFQPTLNLVLPYYISTAVIGLLPLVFLRHMFILRYRLPFPSGTATGVMINGLHTASGSAEGMKQLKTLCQWGGVSLFWSCFKWFFSAGASADARVASCGGFSSWPTFGFKALDLTWNFDGSLTYIGVGMICPHWVNYSMMVGAIVSWGIMWPLLRSMAGHWYPVGLKDKDFNGLFGYQVFIAIAVFMGDGIYNLLKTIYLSVESYREQRRLARSLPNSIPAPEPATAEERHAGEVMARNDEIFAQDHVSMWWCGAGYIASCALAIGVVPVLYPPAKWYYLLIGLIVAPLLAVGNAYGTGLTDWNMSSLYTKLAIFSIAAWAGAERGGVVAGLIAGDLIGGIAGTPAALLGDWKTAHLTRTSVLSMFIVTLVGGFIGCLPGPLIFQIFWKAFPIGDPTSDYKVPYASIYRGLAIMGTQGFGALPMHCSYFMSAFFFGAIAINALRDAVGLRWPRVAALIPVPMAMAIPFYIGANVAVDMALGSLVKAAWFLVSPSGAFGLCIAAASGLIVGDGIWSIFDANLALFKVAQPFCVSFSRGAMHHA